MHLAMLTVPMDDKKVERCRELAAAVADVVELLAALNHIGFQPTRIFAVEDSEVPRPSGH